MLDLLSSRAARVISASVIIAGTAVLAAAAPAGASPYPPTAPCAVSVSGGNIAAGQTLRVTGSGFPSDAAVRLSVDSRATSPGVVHSDANGGFSASVTVPSGLVGRNESLLATAGSMSCGAATAGTSAGSQAVAAQEGTASRNGARQASETASTGFNALIATAIALVVLGSGLLFVMLGRRRRSD